MQQDPKAKMMEWQEPRGTNGQEYGMAGKKARTTNGQQYGMAGKKARTTNGQQYGMAGRKEARTTKGKKPGMAQKQDPGSKKQPQDRVLFPKMILVTGDGRNVGKTTFCTQIIRNLSAKAEVIAIKTTPHKHGLTEGLEVIAKTDEYTVALETAVHQKDSALFLRAGARKVYLIIAEQQHVGMAFSQISKLVQHKICVAESGSLAAYIQPGFFYFIKNHTGEIKKRQYLELNPVVVTNLNREFDFAPEKLDIDPLDKQR